MCFTAKKNVFYSKKNALQQKKVFYSKKYEKVYKFGRPKTKKVHFFDVEKKYAKKRSEVAIST